MNNYIDIYCERLEQGFWAEPVNFLTNIAFIIAGVMALKLARDEGALTRSSGTLIALTFAMGIGSALFHSLATLWAMIADILPILLYQILFIVFYTRARIRLSWSRIIALLAAFLILMQAMMGLPREWLNGTLEYAPALIFLTGLGLWHMKYAARERFILLGAAALFAVSMALRSIDMSVCAAFPLGSHFAWHILNAAVLYFTARGYMRSGEIT